MNGLFKSVFVLLTLLLSAGASADVALRLNKELKLSDAVKSSNWECNFTKKANLAHSSDGSVASTVATMGDVKCVGKNSQKGTFATFELACPTSARDILPTVRECLENGLSEESRFAYESGFVSSTAKKSGVDKYGRTCRYDTLDKKARIIYRKLGDGSWDSVCSTPIKCNNFDKGPKHWLVACKTSGTIKLSDGREADVCPQVADCVEAELPITVPHANIDLAAYSKAISAAQNETVVSSKKKKTH